MSDETLPQPPPRSHRLLAVDLSKLPLYSVEVRTLAGEWYTFTQEPFDTAEAAEIHRAEVLREYPAVTPDRVRVGRYDNRVYRQQLILAIAEDPGLAAEGLATLSTTFLRRLLE